MDENNQRAYIALSLGITEILCQLAEESSELAQAALKLRRAATGINPTPIMEREAVSALLEEYADVENCMELLITANQRSAVKDIQNAKRERWVYRLEESYDGKG